MGVHLCYGPSLLAYFVKQYELLLMLEAPHLLDELLRNSGETSAEVIKSLLKAIKL